MKKIRLSALLIVVAVLLCSCQGAVTTLFPSSSSSSSSSSASSPSASSDPLSPSSSITNTEKTSTTPLPSSPNLPSPSQDHPSITVDPSSPSTSLPPQKEFIPFVPEEKVVAFTFDDGPDYWTKFILDVIDGTEDKLTFFVTYQAKRWLDGTIYEDSLRRAHSLGCEIGIHSKNHAYIYTASTGTDASSEVLQTELYDFAKVIAEITGEEPKIFRPVGGSFNTKKDYGYPAILWSVDSKDWIISAKYWDEGLKNHQIQDQNEKVRQVVEKATKELVDTVVSNVKSGDIVLMHDVHFISKNAFPEIYRQLKEQGYRFVTVSELLQINPTEQHGYYFFSTSEYGKDGMLYHLTDTGIVSEQFAVKPSKEY